MLTGFSDSRMNSEDYDAYDYLDWVLAGFYSVMLVFAFHGLAKTIFGNNASDPLFPKEQSKRRSGKRTFYFISTLLIIARCSFFIIRPLWIHQQIISNGVAEIWTNIGALLCVIAYATLLIFFAGFYYDIDGDRARSIWKKVKVPGYALLLIVSGLSGAYICAVMIYRDSKKIEDLDMYFACVMIGLSWILSIGFLYFGVMIWKVVAKYRLLSETRLIHAKRIIWISLGMTICFIGRSLLTLYSVILSLKNWTTEYSIPFYVVAIYYTLLEQLPISLMLVLLSKLPNLQEKKSLPTGSVIVSSSSAAYRQIQ